MNDYFLMGLFYINYYTKIRKEGSGAVITRKIGQSRIIYVYESEFVPAQVLIRHPTYFAGSDIPGFVHTFLRSDLLDLMVVKICIMCDLQRHIKFFCSMTLTGCHF